MGFNSIVGGEEERHPTPRSEDGHPNPRRRKRIPIQLLSRRSWIQLSSRRRGEGTNPTPLSEEGYPKSWAEKEERGEIQLDCRRRGGRMFHHHSMPSRRQGLGMMNIPAMSYQSRRRSGCQLHSRRRGSERMFHRHSLPMAWE